MKLEALEKGNYYHIFNRGVNGETIFKNDDNKIYFLNLINKHLDGKASILGYCLMDNHFHFLLEIISESKEANHFIQIEQEVYLKNTSEEKKLIQKLI